MHGVFGTAGEGETEPARGREEYGLRFASCETPELLDYRNTQLLMIVARSGEEGLEESLGEGRGEGQLLRISLHISHANILFFQRCKKSRKKRAKKVSIVSLKSWASKQRSIRQRPLKDNGCSYLNLILYYI